MDLNRLVTINLLGKRMSINRAMFVLACLDEGIIPPPESRVGSLTGSPFLFIQQLSPEDQRKARRKFRKLQRKAKKQQQQEIEVLRSKKGCSQFRGLNGLNRADRYEIVKDELARIDQEFGVPGKEPTRAQRRARRQAVMEALWEKIPKTEVDVF